MPHIFGGGFGLCVVEKKEMLTAEEWSVDQQMLSKLKEQYKRERHRDTKSGAAGSGGHISDSELLITFSVCFFTLV